MSYNIILNRGEIESQIKKFLTDFHNHSSELTFKKGIYLYGSSGCGKSHFVKNILQEMNYDIINYDAGEDRKSVV